MKQKTTNGMLLIGVLLLGAFIWFFERDTESSTQQQIRKQTVFSIYPATITSLITQRDGVEIECSKSSGEWRMIRPVEAAIDVSIMEKMIAGMAQVKRGERISAKTLKDRGLSPADYGFDEPRASISFRNNRGTSTWLIGRDAPLGDMLYVMESEGGDIISTSKKLLVLVPSDPAWIRDRALFHGEVSEIQSLDLHRAEGFIQLQQTAPSEWNMEQPFKARLDLLAVHNLTEKILPVRIIQFITDEAADLTIYELKSPAYELTVSRKNNQSKTLQIGKVHPENPELRYAKWEHSNAIFTLSTEWVKLLDVNTDRLRNRHLLGVLPARISTFTIKHGETQTDLSQVDGTWTIEHPSTWEADSKKINHVLESLSQAQILDFIDTPTPEEEKWMSQAPWTITFVENQKTHTLRITDINTNGVRFVQRDEEPAYYLTTPDLIEDDFANPLFFREKTVLEIAPESIKKITRKSDGNEVTVHAAGNRFTVHDNQSQPDAKALINLTTELSALRTEQYIAFNPPSLEPFGLDTPSTRLTISLNATNTLGRVILLGEPTESGRFAMVQGQEIVFVLSEKTVQTLTQKLTQPLEEKPKELERP